MSITRKTPLTFSVTSPPSGVPIGTAIMWMGSTTNIPSGWLIANGATFSASDYPELYTVLGTSTLPNMLNRYPKFTTTAKQLGNSGLPNITAGSPAVEFQGGMWGAFYQIGSSGNSRCGDQDHWGPFLGFDASRSNGIYGRSGDVETQHVTTIPLIKAA